MQLFSSKCKCRKCGTHHEYYEDQVSLYDILACLHCGNKAMVCDYDHRVSVTRFFNRMNVFEWCPYCSSRLGMFGMSNDGSYNLTEVCHACGRNLLEEKYFLEAKRIKKEEIKAAVSHYQEIRKNSPTLPEVNDLKKLAESGQEIYTTVYTPDLLNMKTFTGEKADGCGSCEKCGFVYLLNYDNAVCPDCNFKMDRKTATNAALTYPDPYPPKNQKSKKPEPVKPIPEVKPPESTKWHYVNENGDSQGPFSLEKIKEKIKNKIINENTQIWNKDLSNWTEAWQTELENELDFEEDDE